MMWLVALFFAIGLWRIGSSLRRSEEVYSLAVKIASLMSSVWAFIISPSIVQISILFLLLGWNFISSSRAMHYPNK